MGRKKIQISRITDERNRQVTFNKRKFGVMKKAYELSVLCDCEIALIIFSSSNKLYQYASTDMDKVLLKYTEYNEPHESITNKNIIEKENKNGVMSPESPEQDADYTLTPRTEAKYNKMEEEFQLVMQRNQIAAAGARVGMSATNYTLPVSVPVAGAYGETAMLQASPQMAHHNISPRPSSSETDSVYPAGSMLEMSNGYPHSASPLGGSPSPGPSPGIAHHIKHSPVNASGRTSNLRVVIPTPTMASNISAPEDITYADQRQTQSTLNTPIVTLQTPIPLQNYSLSTFGPQDFSMNSDVMSLPSWTTHPSLTTVQHTSGLPHLAVSNSTPPPSTSPVSVKVKSEPVSPPRDHSQSTSGGSSNSGSGPSGNSSTIIGQNHHHHHHHHHHPSTIIGQTSTGAISITTMNTAAVIAGGQQTTAANLSVLSHPQHLVMSRPSSTGHLTPTPGTITPTNVPSPVANDLRHTHTPSSQLSDYDSPQAHKRPRISEGWST
ncbi:myocyte-specific enhancer factor 2 isoform X2 [Condylostylus longicornis]|uniref:myocyte-specific enhancer factor 2 isoform X2 n=1 Tax=Condylostylus longicornis TaxID=2530218 RepID=UPI00244DFB28|nr:myocyte-specific enhancer factor 2 isoform X2 [Condylostylus longicornis]